VRAARFLLLAALLLASEAGAGGDVRWGYSGERGPEHWGELSEEFSACSAGKSQSPIDVTNPVDANLAPLVLSLGGRTTSVTNNGHTLEATVGPGSWLEVEGERYQLRQLHVHSPSEHRIDGESFALEAHFVHRNTRGDIAVLAVLFRAGARHEGLARVGRATTAEPGSTAPLSVELEELAIVPAGRSYYRYPGSLTTPPCTEGVLWVILKATSTISREQIETFVSRIGEDARDLQPLNGRLVLD